MTRLKLLSVVTLLIVLFSSVAHAAPAQAAPLQATCKVVGSYTDYYKSKPSLMIYYTNGHPAASKITMQYYNSFNSWETVPKTDWGVRVDAPQNKSGGWSYYFIATRWYGLPWHSQWNDDWRWKVTICE